MFTRLAKFQPFESQRGMLRCGKAMHSNDNLPGRRPAGERRSPPSALACHWHLNQSDDRLECHWETTDLEEGSAGIPILGAPKSIKQNRQ
jgi:hypothetical protein